MLLSPRPEGVPKGTPLGAHVVAGINGPDLPKPGTYSLELQLDGNHVGSVIFTAALPPLQQRQAA